MSRRAEYGLSVTGCNRPAAEIEGKGCDTAAHYPYHCLFKTPSGVSIPDSGNVRTSVASPAQSKAACKVQYQPLFFLSFLNGELHSNLACFLPAQRKDKVVKVRSARHDSPHTFDLDGYFS